MDGVDADSPGRSGGWNDYRSAQLFIALERCGAIFLHWQKGVMVRQGTYKGCDFAQLF